MADSVATVSVDDPKRTRILDAAMRLVLAYGYSRTTMDDLAKAADMSRPAIYLHFRNKTDVYRAVARREFDRCQAHVTELVRSDRPFGERMLAAIEHMTIDVMCSFVESPHGQEIIELKSELAGDIVRESQRLTSALFSEAIAREADRLCIDLRTRGLCAEVLAELLVDGMEGMHMRETREDALRRSARQMVRVIEIAIGAWKPAR